MKSVYAMKLEHLYDLWDQYEGEKRWSCFTDRNSRFAIYGAGFIGVRIASLLKEQFGASPFAFIDRKAEEGIYYVDNIPVYSRCELFAIAGDIPVGVALKSYLNGKDAKEINETLSAAGFSRIINIATFDAYDNDFFYINEIDREKTVCVIDMLRDRVSKEQYYSYIYSRVWKTQFYAPTYPASSSYCATELFWLNEKDHVLDCGAFDGDSAQQFLFNFPDLRYITMFEPDPILYERLNNWIQRISNKDIRAVPKAVGNINGEIGFVFENDEASRIDNKSKDKVICCRIDDMEFDTPPSFIKMDIEGAELEALHGAEKTILKFRPILAVSCYHKASDIYEIPLFIKKLRYDYRVFFKKHRHMYNSFDFNMFAIPPERLLSR